MGSRTRRIYAIPKKKDQARVIRKSRISSNGSVMAYVFVVKKKASFAYVLESNEPDEESNPFDRFQEDASGLSDYLLNHFVSPSIFWKHANPAHTQKAPYQSVASRDERDPGRSIFQNTKMFDLESEESNLG
ncbi:hypothetical protein TNCV_1344761 [Trichonephila clavipes]|nr:hypothetical protein TNCV_1344761 [Trichonephila clavipes]